MMFKKRISKSIAIALVGITISTPLFNTVSAMELSENSNKEDSNIEREYTENYLKLVLDDTNNIDQNIENYPRLILDDDEIKEINNYLEAVKNGEIKVRQKRALPLILAGWAGQFIIPGVGTIVVTAAGHIIAAGVTIAAGSYVGKKIQNHIYNSKKKDAESAAKKIPSRLKKGNGNVDLGKFTEKVKGVSSTWKDPKTGWVKQKDRDNHRGYDGSVKEWKIKRNPHDKGRVASVNSSGKVIDK